MKRYMALVVMVFCLASQVFCVSAENIWVINGPEVYNRVAGEGYYDASGKSIDSYSVVDGSSIIHHVGDWSAYDISFLSGGSYRVRVNVACKAKVSYQVRLDGVVALTAGQTGASGSYGTYAEYEIGTIYIPAGTQHLYLENVGGGSTYLKTFSLEFLSEENLTLLTSAQIAALDVLPGGEGVGYHDERTSGGKEGFETDGGSTVCLRHNEWVAYDVSKFRAGTYRVRVSISCKGKPDYTFELDDSSTLVVSGIEATGDYLVYGERKLGYINFDGTQQVLKLLVPGTNASYLAYIELERLEPIACTGINGNVGMAGQLLPRGTDRIVMQFNNELTAESITAQNFQLCDAAGTAVDTAVSTGSTAKEVFIDLFASLDYDAAYTLYANGLTDEDGQQQEQPIEFSFETTDESNGNGVRTIADVEQERTDMTFSVSGTVLSSVGNPMGGQNVALYVQAPNETEPVKVAEGLSVTAAERRGSFSLSYTLPSDAAAGKYTYFISGDYIGTADRYENVFFYYNSDLDRTISQGFSDCATDEAVQAALDSYGEFLGVDLQAAQQSVPDFSYVLKGMQNRSFADTETVSHTLATVICSEKINQADSAAALGLVLTDAENRTLLKMDETAWQVLTDDEKETIYSGLFSQVRFDDEEALQKAANAAIYHALRERMGLNVPQLTADDVSIYAGEAAAVVIGFGEPQSLVNSITVNFDYDASATALYEADSEITFISAEQQAQTEAVRGEHGIVLTLTFAEPTSVEKIGTLQFSAPSGLSGSYAASVSASVVYAADSIQEGLCISIDATGLTATVKVSQKTISGGRDSYSGGGGAGGGGSYSKSDVKVTQKTDTTPVVQQPSVGFNDLAGYDWAAEAIEALREKEVLSGRSNTEFAPADGVTRAEICKMLVLALGKADSTATCDFNDVAADSWYYGYVAQAAADGLVLGDGAAFYPNAELTREDLAVILVRALQAHGVSLSETKSFADQDQIADYAKEAVGALYAAGMVSGMENDRFCPKQIVTRAMAAKMIYAVMQKIA